MKILKITFTNINSLRGEHEIDFTKEPFISSSLFAITGPTGSGKSTLLDVISLALYGKIPRIPGNRPISKTDIEKTGTILTRNQKEAIARVTYKCRHGIFTSQWNISTNSNNNLRDNRMEIFDHQKQELITEKKTEVPPKNEELIGLSYDQFIKAVLLAQGEFAQFLKVTKKERGALLEKITGTGVYRLIGQKVYEKNGLLNKDIEQQQNEIKIIQDKLLEDESLKEKKAAYRDKSKVLENFQKEIENLNKTLALKENIQKKTTEIKLLGDERLSAAKKLEIFNKEHGAPLKQHEKVQDCSEDLRHWNLVSKDITHLKTEQAEGAENLKVNSDKTSELFSEVSTFTKTEITSANFAENLGDFRKKILDLQQKRKEKQNDYKLEKSQMESELESTGINFNDSNPEFTLREIQQKKTEAEAAVKEWIIEFKVSEIGEIENLKNKLQQKYRTTKEAKREYSKIEEIQQELSRNSSEYEKLQPQLRSLPTEIEKQEILVTSEKKDLENLNLKRENELLKANLEQHRHKLKDGEACPLCGALEHPYAENLPEKDDQLNQEIRKVEKHLEDLTARLNAFVTNLDSYKKQAETLKKTNNKLSENLQDQRTNFREKFSDITEAQNLQELEERCDQLENKVEILSQFEQEQKNLQHLNKALPRIVKLQSIIQEGKTLKEKLDELYTGDDIQKEVEGFQKRWISLESDLKNLKNSCDKIVKQLSEKEKELQTLEKDLQPKLNEKGFDKILDGFSALMQDIEVSKLRDERQQIQKKIDDAGASLKILNAQLEELQKLDTDNKEEDIREKLKEKKEQCEEISDECNEINRILKNQEENLTRMQELQEAIAEKEKQTRRWRMLNELIGDRTGNKFNDFAQDLTLSQLIKLANVRLKGLSDRYLIDKPTDEEDDGLVAIDEHMGGQRRSVKTLSGGETFLLSLSMALALSDLASKNVEINSLFIDEGFGTLDPETLDQTLDTLERLQTESSKTIGVISHVDSLKERISTQIQLTRNGQGYSSLFVK